MSLLLLFCISSAFNSAITSSLVCNEKESFSDRPYMRLPRIDLLQYTNGTNEDKKSVVSSFKEDLHQFGSVSLYNHQIPFELMDAVNEAAHNFHHRDDEYKSQFASNGVGTPGFDKFQSLDAAYSYDKSNQTDGDYTEMFATFNHETGSNDYNTYLPLAKDAPSELAITKDYIPHIRRVLKIVHNIASEALLGFGNDNFFENVYSTTPHFQVRTFWYPQLNDSNLIQANKYRISEHKDYLGFTLFYPGNGPGLQNKIGGTNGIWIDCQTNGQVEYDIFVNVGELFDIWTNGYWLGNWHRVKMDEKERMTISYFTGPDNDLLIKPIDGCDVCTKEPSQYVERTAAEHAILRFSKGDRVNPGGKKFFTD